MREYIKLSNSPSDIEPHLLQIASMRDDVKILRLTYDADEGFNENEPMYRHHVYSVRPYIQTYGCDGTTDSNIHLIAKTVCHALDIDYLEMYKQAYPDADIPAVKKWFDSLEIHVGHETVLPGQINQSVIMNVLHDLYEINNRSLVDVLEDCFRAKGFKVDQWFNVVKKWYAE
ncbi:MAG: hypothetical protein QM500_12280 [Methylococcales bacterium]